jgi:hypothetical protein
MAAAEIAVCTVSCVRVLLLRFDTPGLEVVREGISERPFCETEPPEDGAGELGPGLEEAAAEAEDRFWPLDFSEPYTRVSIWFAFFSQK